MSEADAEDGLHGLDEPLAKKMTRGSILNLHFLPTASSLEEARPSPVSAHSILKKSPREKISMERRNGARAERRVREALVGL
jgi:hypothetical protein